MVTPARSVTSLASLWLRSWFSVVEPFVFFGQIRPVAQRIERKILFLVGTGDAAARQLTSIVVGQPMQIVVGVGMVLVIAAVERTGNVPGLDVACVVVGIVELFPSRPSIGSPEF